MNRTHKVMRLNDRRTVRRGMKRRVHPFLPAFHTRKRVQQGHQGSQEASEVPGHPHLRALRRLQGVPATQQGREGLWGLPCVAGQLSPQRGLRNVGATCYLNSIIQALRSIPEFNTLVANHKDCTPLFASLNALLEELQTEGRTPVNPREFVVEFISAVKNPDIRLGYQADAEEALHLLLDALNEGIPKREGLKKPLEELFYGETETTLTCSSCRHTAFRKEQFDSLSLEIPGPGATLHDCLATAFGVKEVLEDYTCDICKRKGTTQKEVRINSFPSRLIITLKRFTNRGTKITGVVTYDPESIDLSEAASFTAEGARYRVASTVEHIGSCFGGHYFMRCRGQGTSPWITFDDASVSQSDGTPKPTTYILFLERV